MNPTPQAQRVQSLAELWTDLMPFDVPETYRLNLWELTHGAETVVYAIEQVALRRAKPGGDSMTREEAVRLVGSICCSVRRAQKHVAATQN